ncbi:MAG: hypothetical protein WDO70_09970 [Alphaproteobacteria bacterium]
MLKLFKETAAYLVGFGVGTAIYQQAAHGQVDMKETAIKAAVCTALMVPYLIWRNRGHGNRPAPV